jgi:hypothetical protein
MVDKGFFPNVTLQLDQSLLKWQYITTEGFASAVFFRPSNCDRSVICRLYHNNPVNVAIHNFTIWQARIQATAYSTSADLTYNFKIHKFSSFKNEKVYEFLTWDGSFSLN